MSFNHLLRAADLFGPPCAACAEYMADCFEDLWRPGRRIRGATRGLSQLAAHELNKYRVPYIFRIRWTRSLGRGCRRQSGSLFSCACGGIDFSDFIIFAVLGGLPLFSRVGATIRRRVVSSFFKRISGDFCFFDPVFFVWSSGQ